MTHSQLQREILSCLWSENLKRTIAETGYRFTEEDLLGIACHFAPSFSERLRLLGLLADHAPGVSSRALAVISWQNDCLAWFRQAGVGEIYELLIKETPDAWEERYLCQTYETALEMLAGFCEEYDCDLDTDQSYCAIRKRKILQPGKPFEEDWAGECDFARGKILVSVDGPPHMTENGPCPSGGCADCENRCVSDLEPCFPAFVPDCAPVCYRLGTGRTALGIHLNSNHLPEMERCYIIPFEGELLSSGNYEEHWAFHDHEHIPCPNVELVPVEALSPVNQERYHRFLRWWQEKMKKST